VLDSQQGSNAQLEGTGVLVMTTRIKDVPLADNYCKCCNGTGLLPHPSVGFELKVGDVVEDHCGLLVRIDDVWSEDPTVGWGTTLNAPDSWIVGPNHSNHRVQTDNDHYKESLWTLISRGA
jgi:hypothetical protein